nr:hypothetical protein [Anaerolineae bacterium]
MSEHQPRSKGQASRLAPQPAPVAEQAAPAERQLSATDSGLTPGRVLQLQRLIGNSATRTVMAGGPRSLQRAAFPAWLNRNLIIQRDSHEKGCRCTECSRVALKREVIRRVDEHEEDIQALREAPLTIRRVDEHEEDIQAMRIQRIGGGNKAVKEKPKTPKQLVDEATLDTPDKIKALLQTDTLKMIRSKEAMKALAGKIVVKSFVTALMEIGGTTLKQKLQRAFNIWATVTLDDVKAVIEAAPQDQRDEVWQRKKLMKKAHSVMSRDDYLNMLPVLRVFKKGKTAEDGKAHTSASKADEHIRNYLADYTGEAVKAGRQVAGQVSVVDGKDWEEAYDREFGDDGQEDTTNAFVDQQGLIWVHKKRGNAGTVIHEGVHKYANGVFLSEVGFNFNEGVTEYFTRKITKQL